MVFITKLQYPQHLRLKNKKKKKKFFPTCITVSSFFRLTALSMRLVFLFYAQDIYSSHNVRCIHTHIVCYSADGCEHLKVIPLYPQVGWERKATTDQIRGTNSRIMDRNVLCAFSCLRCPFFLFLIPNIQVGSRSSFSLGSYSSFLWLSFLLSSSERLHFQLKLNLIRFTSSVVAPLLQFSSSSCV